MQLCAGLSNCWIGLNDIQTEGVWQWDDGTVTDYGFTNNDNEMPSGSLPWNNGSGQDCVYLREQFNYKWDDSSCTWQHHPICNCPLENNLCKYILVQDGLSWENANAYCLSEYSSI